MATNILHTFAATCGGKTNTVLDTTNLPKACGDQSSISNILTVVFAFSAAISVLLIVIGGLRYILAHGDPNATAQAKNTILYALIGLIVVMAAYSIVVFVVKAIG